MKIPKTVRIAGHDYKVFFDDKYLNKINLFGQCDFVSQKIRLSKKYEKRTRTKSDIGRSFVHEIIHVVDVHYNNYTLTEKEVDRLANGLYQVLADNFIVKIKKGG